MKITKKKLIYILLGIICAAIICVAVGFIVYIPANASVIPESAVNYAQLLQDKALRLYMGMALIIIGCICFSIPAAILLVMLIKKLITENKK